MTADTPNGTAQPTVCPRCRSTTIETVTTSPVPGAWTVFTCSTCLYTWRSSEPAENTDPDKYPAAFRLDPAQLPKLAVAPAVPPLRAASE